MSAAVLYDDAHDDRVEELLRRARVLERSGGPADKVRALRQEASRLALGLGE